MSRAFIGTNTIICSNVIVGDGAIVGVGSVVTKDIAPYQYGVVNFIKTSSE